MGDKYISMPLEAESAINQKINRVNIMAKSFVNAKKDVK